MNILESKGITVQDLGSGICVYSNVLPRDLNIQEKLEESLSGSHSSYSWRPAYVGYQQLMPDYRNCVDFKYKKTDLNNDGSKEYNVLADVWDECYTRQKDAVDDYCARFNVTNLRYWEAFNFIKYEKGHHFQYHHDHGYSYNCTVSLVAYLNDDYEGGGLHFSQQDIMYTPKSGDVVIFPSTYMYPHRAMPVLEGIKYSLVTMLDYSEKYHTPEMYQETGK
jgi:IS1 family transposase